MFPRLSAIVFAALALAPNLAYAQQQREGYKFLEAVRGEKETEVTAMLEKPGPTVINTRSLTNGETALHIVVQRGDKAYLTYLLQRGANPNVRDDAGVAPIVIAAGKGRTDLIEELVKYKANINYGNSSGETALIRAVQRRDLEMVRVLLADGADPDQVDLLAGMSARDYARDDRRTPALAKLLEDAPKKAKASTVAGPKL